MIFENLFALVNSIHLGTLLNIHRLQEGPAQTANYMVAGYVVIFGVMGLYLVSMAVRKKNLGRDLETLQEIKKQAG